MGNYMIIQRQIITRMVKEQSGTTRVEGGKEANCLSGCPSLYFQETVLEFRLRERQEFTREKGKEVTKTGQDTELDKLKS